MKTLLLIPPITMLIILAAALLLMYLFSKLSYRSGKKPDEGRDSYACGEDTYDNMAQVDYSNFFPFAFFFTLAHVATLIITTVPVGTIKTFEMGILYVIGTVVGLSILLRKQ
ncbi:MAG: hypothetical protein WCI77_05935 [Candidatus Omnitrophota bacterium]